MSQANESLKNDIYVRHAKQSLREQKEGSLKPFCLQQQLVQRMFCFYFVIHFFNLFCLVSTTTTMLLFFFSILPDIGNERDRRFATLLTTPRNKVKLLLLLRLLLKLTAKPFSCSLCNAHTQSLFQLGSMGAFQFFLRLPIHESGSL